MDIIVANSLIELTSRITTWKTSANRIALVPTMGNLHDGHLALIREAAKLADRVVVSIFVNPLQFAEGEDFADYPRTGQQDLVKLRREPVDLVYMPAVPEMYRPGAKTTVSVDGLSTMYCGASRPGHFNGVATVVCKLFNQVQPDIALFGLKDYQQVLVVKAMVRDLDMPVQVVGVETVRAVDGLALSSRNHYLTAAETGVAPLLYQTLCVARDLVLAQQTPYPEIERQALGSLTQAGFQPEYFAICRREDLAKAKPDDVDLVILAAAKLGKARLIDNIRFSKSAAASDTLVDMVLSAKEAS